MAKLCAAIVTDIHYGFDIKDKMGSKAPRLMRKFIKAANDRGVDLIVDMGDRISTRNEEDDRAYMKALRKHFNKAAMPVYSNIGNHDIRHLSRAENEEIMGCPADSYTKEVGGYHLVFWNPTFYITETGLEVSSQDMKWLKENIENTDKPAILFSHVPLDNQGDEAEDPYTKYFFWTQGEEIRKILEDAGNVILCMAGHRHRNRHREINGIHYVTQQSLTSQWRERYRIPSGTFSYLELEDGKIAIHLQGKFLKTYELKPKLG